ncbi:MAG: hypothetical protein L6Q60_14200 [Rhodocyclaceae bacterium]|nr:hypothetical protein [Rhodocyclaceae bacterium]
MFTFKEFVHDFCDGRLELPARDACRIAGINYQTIKNCRSDAKRGSPLLQTFVRGNRLYVAAAALFEYLSRNSASGCAMQSPAAADDNPVVRRGPGRPRKLVAEVRP